MLLCVQIQAHVTWDWQGRWRVVIAGQFAYHNHTIIPTGEALGPNADSSCGDSDADAADSEDSELDHSEANAKAAEVLDQDENQQVYPMQKKTFATWPELEVYLQNYSRFSHQESGFGYSIGALSSRLMLNGADFLCG